LHYAQRLSDAAFDLVMSKKEAMQQLARHAGPPPLRFGVSSAVPRSKALWLS
jgi:hypothetical protein